MKKIECMQVQALAYVILLCASTSSVRRTTDPILISIDWSTYEYVLHTVPSLQIVANPLVSRQFSPIYETIFDNLAQLNADFVRYAAWYPYPKMAVAALDPPSGLSQCGNVAENFSVHLSCQRGGGVISKIGFASYGTAGGPCGKMRRGECHAPKSFDIIQQVCIGQQECNVPAANDLFGDPCVGMKKRLLIQMECDPPQNNTYWDFTYIDPIFQDFLQATEGHPQIVMFSTQPDWLFKLNQTHLYPDNATAVDWDYPQGSELIDETMNALGNYYGRLVAWYTSGGFTDEYGQKWISNYAYDWEYTEIFHEIESEHRMSAEYYTRAYDAVVQGIRRHTNNTKMKYVGMALGGHDDFYRFQYFLNHSNHAPDIPLDMISYHLYATCDSRTDPYSYEQFFARLDSFLLEVEHIEDIRKALSPNTRTTINELGVILPHENNFDSPEFPLLFWNAGAAFYAYSWAQLARQGIDIIGHSQLVGYPYLRDLQLDPQFPTVSMLNWTTGEGTAKYWVSKLLIDSSEIDQDRAVVTHLTGSNDQSVFSQGFVRKNGQRWVLVVNKKYASIDILLTGAAGGMMLIVNEASAFGPPIEIQLISNQITLDPFSVAVVHISSEEELS